MHIQEHPSPWHGRSRWRSKPFLRTPAEDLYDRFLGPVAQFADSDVRYLVEETPTSFAIACEDDAGTLLGLLNVALVEDWDAELGLLVAPEVRRLGIGGLLADLGLLELCGLGRASVHGLTRSENRRIAGLLRQRGFAESFRNYGTSLWRRPLP